MHPHQYPDSQWIAGNGVVRRGGRVRQPTQRAVDNGSFGRVMQQSSGPFKDGDHLSHYYQGLLGCPWHCLPSGLSARPYTSG